MKISIFKHLLITALGAVLTLLASCSHPNKVKINHSFTAALNVEQNIEEFNKVSFNAFNDLNLGFFRGNIWIKLTIKNASSPNSYMIINDDIFNRNYTFYKLDSVGDSLQLVKQIKDYSRQDHRTNNSSMPNFKIELGANEEATYLLVTSSDGRTVNATPRLISMEEYSSLTTEHTIWNTVFFGFIVFLTLINVYQWNIHRQQIYFYYIFYMIATFFMYLGLEGKLYNWGFKHVIIDHVIFISVRLWVLSLIAFTIKFLKVQSTSQVFYQLVKWTLFIVLGVITFYQLIFYSTSIANLHYFENLLSFLWLLLILGIIMVSAKTRKLEVRYYLTPLLFLLVFVTLGLIDGHFQILPGSPFLYIKIGTIIEFFGFTYFMSTLIKRKLEKTTNLETELQKNQKELSVISGKLKEKENIITSKIDLTGIFNLVENSLSTEAKWDDFKLKLTELNPVFLEQLLVNHPELSKAEIRLLTLIKVGYTQKEIAEILNIAPDSVKKAKSRTRKKLGLSESITLNQYLLGIDKRSV